MSNYLKDKVVVVTGAAGGFGRLIALKSSALGASVVCSDVDESTLSLVVQEVATDRVIGITADVTNLKDLQELVEGTIGRLGRVDVMINNAGIMPLAFYQDHEKAIEAWHNCIDINIKGVLNGIVAVYDQMISQGRGHVVNLSSIYGNFPVSGAGVYGASKAAVNFLSESLRVESQGKIKVTTVKPTGVPGTGLGQGIINQEAIIGILGQNSASYLQMMQAHLSGELPEEHRNPENIEYYALDPSDLADQVIYAINQPWGVSIGEVTVRASGDAYIL